MGRGHGKDPGEEDPRDQEQHPGEEQGTGQDKGERETGTAGEEETGNGVLY